MAYNVSIDTAQNVKLNYELAGIGTRIPAFLIDELIKSAYIVLLVVLAVNLSDRYYLEDEIWAVIGIFAFLPVMFYSFVLETLFDGQTPGKKVMHIKVVRIDGSAPGIGNYFMRWLFRIIDFQCFSGLVAIIAISASQKGQRIGDMVAGTTVILISRDTSFNDIPLFHLEEEEEYVTTYPEAVKLSDRDVSIITRILKNSEQNYNPEALSMTVKKVKEVTGITEVKQRDRAFLNTILKDYGYLMMK
ncbi:MAG: RDD family protein [Candidatus Azobacteroides sp.]|nr:RDD family protein [Candidatus Azobacteroides sp.]